mgnify:CR=1 FL=1
MNHKGHGVNMGLLFIVLSQIGLFAVSSNIVVLTRLFVVVGLDAAHIMRRTRHKGFDEELHLRLWGGGGEDKITKKNDKWKPALLASHLSLEKQMFWGRWRKRERR